MAAAYIVLLLCIITDNMLGLHSKVFAGECFLVPFCSTADSKQLEIAAATKAGIFVNTRKDTIA